jgi:hypothetical protein
LPSIVVLHIQLVKLSPDCYEKKLCEQEKLLIEGEDWKMQNQPQANLMLKAMIRSIER